MPNESLPLPLSYLEKKQFPELLSCLRNQNSLNLGYYIDHLPKASLQEFLDKKREANNSFSNILPFLRYFEEQNPENFKAFCLDKNCENLLDIFRFAAQFGVGIEHYGLWHYLATRSFFQTNNSTLINILSTVAKHSFGLYIGVNNVGYGFHFYSSLPIMAAFAYFVPNIATDIRNILKLFVYTPDNFEELFTVAYQHVKAVSSLITLTKTIAKLSPVLYDLKQLSDRKRTTLFIITSTLLDYNNFLDIKNINAIFNLFQDTKPQARLSLLQDGLFASTKKILRQNKLLNEVIADEKDQLVKFKKDKHGNTIGYTYIF